MIDWERYFAAMRGMPLHPLYGVLERHLPEHGHAIELGCGTGQGVEFLLNRGWTVTAIDNDPRAIAETRDRVDTRANLIEADVSRVPLPQAEAVIAGFLFFLLDKPSFEQLWSAIEQSLKPGGWLQAQFLGPNDTWSAAGALWHSDDEVATLLSAFDVVHHEVIERDGKTAWGEQKHWHIHHIVAQKK